ncbi:MAG TPA: hypothetical protein VJT09_17975 [Pyrinomonadaceae bacterium]|nr:hypothetical protein [Pyrinomonadaceae bacterium]
MKLLRLTLLTIIIPASAFSALAQQAACTLKQAPEFNGFQLGMTVPEVKDRLADTSMFDAKISGLNKIGAQTIRISGAELKDEYAEGIDDMNLTFVDKRLAMVRATYHTGAGSWFGAKDFFKQLAQKLGLPEPPDAASSSSGRGGEKYRVDCTGFNVTLGYAFGVSPNVTIADATAQKLIDERSERNPDGDVRTINITPGGGRSRQPMPSPTPTIPPR